MLRSYTDGQSIAHSKIDHIYLCGIFDTLTHTFTTLTYPYTTDVKVANFAIWHVYKNMREQENTIFKITLQKLPKNKFIFQKHVICFYMNEVADVFLKLSPTKEDHTLTN